MNKNDFSIFLFCLFQNLMSRLCIAIAIILTVRGRELDVLPFRSIFLFEKN
jgi:hypothetical protein